jgi:hypothetical protein
LALVVAVTAATTAGAADGVEAYFTQPSYRPGSAATLVVRGSRASVTVELFRVGPRARGPKRADTLWGWRVSLPVRLRLTGSGDERRARVPLRTWQSGVYYAQLTDTAGRVGYAPFVLAPTRLGEHRVAVVLPTNTWAAYNRRDDDGDGVGDTWYEDSSRTTVDLRRPFLDRGVPPYFNRYDFGFLRWMALRRTGADYLSQRELETGADGAGLARAYDLIVFPGHHEYVTRREYDAVERFRDLGGNLMFLSANNVFYEVTKRGRTMTRVGRWRDTGRPEAGLVGTQYVDVIEALAPYVIRRAPAARWIFAGTGLGPGARFGHFGIELDRRTAASPPGTQVVAEIPNLAGSGLTAQMTYYELGGAKVFAAGAFTLGGAALWGQVSQVLENLWRRLALP